MKEVGLLCYFPGEYAASSYLGSMQHQQTFVEYTSGGQTFVAGPVTVIKFVVQFRAASTGFLLCDNSTYDC
jgi:hypothetical protein